MHQAKRSLSYLLSLDSLKLQLKPWVNQVVRAVRPGPCWRNFQRLPATFHPPSPAAKSVIWSTSTLCQGREAKRENGHHTAKDSGVSHQTKSPAYVINDVLDYVLPSWLAFTRPARNLSPGPIRATQYSEYTSQ